MKRGSVNESSVMSSFRAWFFLHLHGGNGVKRYLLCSPDGHSVLYLIDSTVFTGGVCMDIEMEEVDLFVFPEDIKTRVLPSSFGNSTPTYAYTICCNIGDATLLTYVPKEHMG